MSLPENTFLNNHLGDIHAAAQYALAESGSAHHLVGVLKDLQQQVLPLLRSSEVKYRHPARGDLSARCEINEQSLNKFREKYSSGGRALINVNVEVVDKDGLVTMTGLFKWYLILIQDN